MSDQVEIQTDPDDSHRILVLAHQGLGGPQLIELLDRQQPERGSEVLIVVPALSGSVRQLANDDRETIAAAGDDMQRLETPGRSVRGLGGDSDPRLALEDPLRQFAADEVVVVNPGEAEMGHLEQTSTARALEDVPLPVSVINVTAD